MCGARPRVRLGIARDECEHERRPAVRARGRDEDAGRLGRGEKQSSEGGSGEDADAVDHPRGDVRRRELLGAAREHRQEGPLRGPERRRRDSHEPGEREHDPVVRARVGGDRGAGDQPRADKVGRDHHAAPPVTVREDGDERRGEGGRDRPDDGHLPHRLRPAGLVRVDREADAERELAHDRSRGGELQAAKRGVSIHLAEGPKRLAHSREYRPHARSIAAAFGDLKTAWEDL